MRIAQPQYYDANYNALARNRYYIEVLDGSRQAIVFLYHGTLVDDFIASKPGVAFTEVIIPFHFNRTMKKCRLSRHHTQKALKLLSTLGYIKKWPSDSNRTYIQFTGKAVELLHKAWQPEVVERELAKWSM